MSWTADLAKTSKSNWIPFIQLFTQLIRHTANTTFSSHRWLHSISAKGYENELHTEKAELYNWNKISLDNLPGIPLQWGRNQISRIVPLLDFLNFDFLQLLLRISCPACLKAIYHRPQLREFLFSELDISRRPVLFQSWNSLRSRYRDDIWPLRSNPRERELRWSDILLCCYRSQFLHDLRRRTRNERRQSKTGPGE